MIANLTDDQILMISVECAASHQHDDVAFARAIIAADRALRVPMTDEEINDAYGLARVQHDHIPHDDVVRIVRAAERFHGIGG